MRRQAQDDPRWLQVLFGRVKAIPAIFMLVGVTASVVAAGWMKYYEDALAQAAFDRIVARVEGEVRQRFTLPLYGLRGAHGTVEAIRRKGQRLERDQFRAYVETRNLDHEFPGVRGFGFIEHVERPALAPFLAAQRADRAPDFAVRQLADRDHADLHIITYIEPLASNPGALGLDVGSEANRRRAIEQAIATGQPTITEPITLVQDGQKTPGFLIYLPTYRTAATPAEPAQRLAAQAGVLFSPVVARELLADVVLAAQGQVDFTLFAGNITSPPAAVVFEANRDAGAGAEPTGRFDVTRSLNLLGGSFTLRLTSTPAFDAGVRPITPALLLLGGLLLTGVLAWLAHLTVAGRARAEALAQGMSSDLSRLAEVARRTSDIVVITDLSRCITWVNAAFEVVTGYTPAEALGRTPGSLLQFERTDPAAVSALRAALDAGQAYKGELLNRGKGGRVYWIELEVQPIRDAQGAITGFLAVQSDITDRKNAERELGRERQRLSNIIDGTQVGTWEWNVETGVTVFNERWADIVGYTLDELGPTSIDTWTRLTHPDDMSRSSIELERHFDGITTAFECEARMRHRDGHWVWVLDRGKLFSRSEDGRPRWMAGTHMDITGRKLAEAALRSSQAFLDRTGRIGGVGGWELDAKSKRLHWSDQTCRILEVPEGHVPTEQEAAALYASDDARSAIAAAMVRCVRTGHGFDLEVPVRTAKGREIWVRLVGEAQYANGHVVSIVGALQNVTQRRMLEAEVRDRNTLLASVLENLPCGLSVFNGQLELVASNRQYRNLLGFPDQLFDAQPPRLQDFVRYSAGRGEYGDVDVEETVRSVIDRARLPVKPHQFESVRPNSVPLEVRGGPLPGGGFITTYTDISTRHHAQAEVKRSADLLQGAIEALDEAFVLFDPDDRLVLCNERYKKVYSSVAHLMVPGAKFEDIVRAGAQQGDYEAAIGRVDDWVAERVAVHQAANTTVVQQLSNGSTLRIIERKLADGHIVGFRIDISEIVQATRHAEQASADARRALARLQTIYDILPVGLTITDPQGWIIDCNPASERLLGISKAEHLARDLGDREWQVLREDGSAMPQDEFASVRALVTGQPVHDAVMQVVTPQRKVWLSVSAMPVPDEDLGVVVGYVDITEQLAQRQALLEAKAQAEGANVAKSQFLANMSHEIRTPMNAILGMLALLRKTEMTARQADYASKTEGAARSLLGLLNDILDFSKVEAGKLELDPRPMRIDQVMSDLSVILSAGVGNKNLEVLFDIDARIPPVLVGDPMRLQQVLINLGGNAVKFTAEGEVVISIEVLDQQAAAVTLAFSVRDTGIGIAPENQSRIFSGFTQAEASTTRRFGGTGLGVAISQRLVGLMGGEIRLQSALGAGTRFSFDITLPVAATGSAASDVVAAGPSRGTADDGCGRMLVVDDNPTARQVLSNVARSLGWHVHAVAGGALALQALRTESEPGSAYDAVLLDWRMPDLDGWETARQVREQFAAGGAPLLLMVTASGREMLANRSAQEQALIDGFLVKPVTHSMLAQALAEARRDPADRLPANRRAGVPARRLEGLRLLVVEDNSTNQQVARELLEDEGAAVQIAEHGQAAVDAVTSGRQPFDLVLMDLQMPVMDGLTATREIRRDPAHQTLPIVAMTANAMASDSQACLQAGMNDHVGKPFDLDHLVRVINRLVGRTEVAAGAPVDVQDNAQLPATLIEAAVFAGVNLDQAMGRLGGKPAVYQRTLRSFLGDLRDMPEALGASIADGDLVASTRLLHTLKGVAATLGATGLSALAADAERAMTDAGAGVAAIDLDGLTRQMCDAMVSAHAGLSRLLSALGVPDPADAETRVVDADALRSALQSLGERLRDSDMAALDAMDRVRRHAGDSMADAITQLDDALSALDFDVASAHCQSMLDQLTA